MTAKGRNGVSARLYNPEKAFFDKTWRPSEIEPI